MRNIYYFAYMLSNDICLISKVLVMKAISQSHISIKQTKQNKK